MKRRWRAAGCRSRSGQEARTCTVWDLAQAGDLSGFSAVLFGDAASGKRRDLATGK